MTTAAKTRKLPKPTTTRKPTTKTTARTEAGTTATHSRMHRDHLQWMNDTAMWQDDLVEWQSELRRIRLELKQLDSLLEEHGQQLVDHAESLLALRKSLQEHEHEIVRYEQGGDGQELIAGARGHQAESEKHTQQLASHDDFKQRHRAIVSQWDRLHKVINDLSKS